MSLRIPQEHLLNPDLLTEEELRYLWTHDPVRFNRLGLERPDMPEPSDEVPARPTRVTPLEEQTVPTISDKGGIIDEVEEDYEEGWNNNQRRAELARRGLSVDGNKDQLIARLRRSDANALEDDDYSKV